MAVDVKEAVNRKRAVEAKAAVNRRMLTREQTADYLNVSENTLARWACERQGPPFVKIGRGANAAVRYPSDLLDEYIESRMTQAKN